MKYYINKTSGVRATLDNKDKNGVWLRLKNTAKVIFYTNDEFNKYWEEITEKEFWARIQSVSEPYINSEFIYVKPQEGYCTWASFDGDTLKTDNDNITLKVDNNNVEHPHHYNQGKYECIDVMEEVYGVEAVKNFCLCNAFKYIWRTNEKNGIEDIDKAICYLNKYEELNK